MTTPLRDDDYVLGTGDEELARLGLQHAVWRPHAADAWKRAGFTAGQHLVDVGCGPGSATFDLAAIAGPTGKVTALDRSRRFLDVLEHRAAVLGLQTVTPVDLDLDAGALPVLGADGAWCRWVFAFVKRPRALLEGVRELLRPGGTLVFHEYYHYAGWQLVPRVPDFDAFVGAVIKSWRESGGEPDVALDLIPWLVELGFEVVSIRPIVDVPSPADFVWQWPKAFVTSGLARMVELGHLTAERAGEVRRSFDAASARPGVRMITPGVMEVIARRE